MEAIEKDRALETALLNIEKQFGKGSVMRLGDAGTDTRNSRADRSDSRFGRVDRFVVHPTNGVVKSKTVVHGNINEIAAEDA